MTDQNQANAFFRYTAFRQFILFVGCYCLLKYLYFQIPDQVYSDVIYHYGVVSECAALINLVAPLEQVSAIKNHLISAQADLEIIRGCDSAGVFFLIISAMLAFHTRISIKLIGLLSGIAFIYSLNILRISGLYFVVAHRSAWFEFVHIYLAPTLMTLGACLFFAWWAFSCRHVADPA